jgi:hypothetical protein
MSKWTVNFDSLVAKTKANVDAIVRKATFEVYRSVVLRSPIDTGRFRANWNVSFAVPDYSTTLATNEGRGVTEAAKALRMPIGGITYLSNGLPYAKRLEYGWSKQAPAGMVRLAAAEFSRFIARAAK